MWLEREDPRRRIGVGGQHRIEAHVRADVEDDEAVRLALAGPLDDSLRTLLTNAMATLPESS